MNRVVPKPKQPWEHQVFQGRIDFDPRASYVLAFSVCASRELYLEVLTKQDEAPWDYLGLRQQIRVEEVWRRHEFIFPADKAIPKYSRLGFAFVTGEPAAVWIADVSIHKLEDSREVGANLVQNPRFQKGLSFWSVEHDLAVVGEVFNVSVVPVSMLTRAAAAP